MKLDEQTLRLIAIGASITANCQPCLQTNVTKALECGVDEQKIAEAIEELAMSLNHPTLASGGVAISRCDCG